MHLQVSDVNSKQFFQRTASSLPAQWYSQGPPKVWRQALFFYLLQEKYFESYEILVRGFICQDKQIHQYYTYEVTISQVTHNQLGKDGL